MSLSELILFSIGKILILYKTAVKMSAGLYPNSVTIILKKKIVDLF